jgi:hypothetical protein
LFCRRPALCCRSFVIPYTLGTIATAIAYRGYPGHTFFFLLPAIHIHIVSLGRRLDLDKPDLFSFEPHLAVLLFNCSPLRQFSSYLFALSNSTNFNLALNNAYIVLRVCCDFWITNYQPRLTNTHSIYNAFPLVPIMGATLPSFDHTASQRRGFQDSPKGGR